MNNEAVIYVARKLHWSRKEIGKLTPAQLGAVLEELQFQEAQEQYREDYAMASILAAIYNTIPSKSRHVHKPREFLASPEPKRKVELKEAAKKEGIKIPGG